MALASSPQPPSPAGTARALQNAALEAHRQNETRDVVARPRVRTERSADLKLRHRDAQRAIRGTQRRIERTRFADEGHRAVNRRVRGGDNKGVTDVGIGLDTTVGRFEDERRERIIGASDFGVAGDQREGSARVRAEDPAIGCRSVKRGDSD